MNLKLRKKLTIQIKYDINDIKTSKGAMINPKDGEKCDVETAVEKGFVAPRFKKHLLLAEQSVHGYEASNGSVLSLFDAMKLGPLIFFL